MYESVYIQTVAEDFYGRREQDPSILRTFFRLNVFEYKRAGHRDQLASDELHVDF